MNRETVYEKDEELEQLTFLFSKKALELEDIVSGAKIIGQAITREPAELTMAESITYNNQCVKEANRILMSQVYVRGMAYYDESDGQWKENYVSVLRNNKDSTIITRVVISAALHRALHAWEYHQSPVRMAVQQFKHWFGSGEAPKFECAQHRDCVNEHLQQYGECGRALFEEASTLAANPETVGMTWHLWPPMIHVPVLKRTYASAEDFFAGIAQKSQIISPLIVKR